MAQYPLVALLLLAASVQTVHAQKIVLHKTDGRVIEYDIKQLDSITFCTETMVADAKVRIGIYETVPSYEVQDLVFYADATTDAGQANCVLYADADGEASIIDFGKLSDYPLGTSRREASYAGTADDNYYTTCLTLGEDGTDLTMRVDYTLVSTDSSHEIIHVAGVYAQVPAQYAVWETGRAYTYLFKIHEAQGWTADQGISNLFPITLDAVVVGDADDGANPITR